MFQQDLWNGPNIFIKLSKLSGRRYRMIFTPNRYITSAPGLIFYRFFEDLTNVLKKFSSSDFGSPAPLTSLLFKRKSALESRLCYSAKNGVVESFNF